MKKEKKMKKKITKKVEKKEEKPKISKETAKFREVMYKTLTEDLVIPMEEAAEIACKYNRLSILAKAMKDGVELPVSDENYKKIKKLCLCR